VIDFSVVAMALSNAQEQPQPSQQAFEVAAGGGMDEMTAAHPTRGFRTTDGGFDSGQVRPRRGPNKRTPAFLGVDVVGARGREWISGRRLLAGARGERVRRVSALFRRCRGCRTSAANGRANCAQKFAPATTLANRPPEVS
jgi:hypothetical protein